MRSPVVPMTLMHHHQSGGSDVYSCHEELGHGGFAAVYRVTNQSGKSFALKAISRVRVLKPKALEKLKSEIAIQRSLDHPNVVKSFSSFQDRANYYILLELCPGHSARDRLRSVGHVSELEVQRILRDVVAGLCYLHDNHIIHRDLKLENFLFGGDGRIKIADFGLSAKLDYDDERKYTVCGTPNYLSPELLTAVNRGHSYEVDIWAVGVSAFALLTGHPPFETGRERLTYEFIKRCQYRFPSHIQLSAEAKDFIRSILQIRPESRPSAQDLAAHPFLSINIPSARPPPNYQLPERGLADRFARRKPRTPILPPPPPPNVIAPAEKAVPVDQLPICVSRFCDHSDKYGLGYLLVGGTVGACFNDLTRMVMDPQETFVQYWESHQTVIPEVMSPISGTQVKKLSLLRKFSESLKNTKSMFRTPAIPYAEIAPLRHVKYWARNDEATLFRMDDKNIQVNFPDRVKLVIFWAAKTMMMVRNVQEMGAVVPWPDVGASGPVTEERRRFSVAKAIIAEISLK